MNRRQSEALARTLLTPHLRVVQSIAKDLESIARSCIKDLDDPTDAPHDRVRSILAGRLADDLRVLQLLAPIGYAQQVATIGASAYEVAYLMAFVWEDAALAGKWLLYDKAKDLPWTRKVFTRGALAAALPGDSNALETEEVIYSFLCWHKHANPRALKSFAPSPTAARHAINTDPDIRSPTHAVAAFLLSLRAPVIGLMALARARKLNAKAEGSLLAAGKTYFAAQDRLFAKRQ